MDRCRGGRLVRGVAVDSWEEAVIHWMILRCLRFIICNMEMRVNDNDTRAARELIVRDIDKEMHVLSGLGKV